MVGPGETLGSLRIPLAIWAWVKEVGWVRFCEGGGVRKVGSRRFGEGGWVTCEVGWRRSGDGGVVKELDWGRWSEVGVMRGSWGEWDEVKPSWVHFSDYKNCLSLKSSLKAVHITSKCLLVSRGIGPDCFSIIPWFLRQWNSQKKRP